MVFCLLSCARHEAQAIRDPTNQELDDIQREFQVAKDNETKIDLTERRRKKAEDNQEWETVKSLDKELKKSDQERKAA